MWKFLLFGLTFFIFANRSTLIMSYRKIGSRWNKMLPQAQQKSEQLVALAKNNGLNVMFYDGWRAPEETVKNIEAGTSKVDDAYSSLHTWGVAFDIVFIDPTTKGASWLTDNDPRWRKLAMLGESIGLKSGGLMWGWDYPHFQLRGYTAEKLKQQYGNNYNAFLTINGVRE